MVQKQWQLIKQFPLPTDLRDGIVYCQRSLRDCVIQHQNLASKINILPKHQRVKAKQFLIELEGEIVDISQEQEALVRDVSQRVQQFRVYVQRKTNVTIDDEIADGFVARLLHSHNETVGQINRPPANCSYRLSPSELAQKYCLESILKQEKFVHDDNASFVPWSAGQQQQELGEPNRGTKNASKAYPKASVVSTNFSSSSSSSPFPATSSVSRSLLKPKQERPDHQQSQSPPSAEGAEQRVSPSVREPRAFASVIEAEERKPRMAEAKASASASVKHEETSNAITATASKEQEAEDPLAVAAPPAQPPSMAQRPVGVWMPGLRGRPPKGVNYIPPSKLATIQAQQRAYFHRKLRQEMKGVKQGRKSKIVLKSETPSPMGEPDAGPDHDSSEEQSTPATFGRPSAAIRRGRSNLQQALNRLKRPSTGGESVQPPARASGTGLAKKSKATVGSQPLKRGSSASSGSSPSSRSSTPTLSIGRLAGSDDSCDRRCDVPLDSPPCGESVVPPPNDIWELGMKALLNYFNLCTPEEAKARRERRQERKRRSCYSTERKDFHYGRLDYYEQQQLQAATRTSKRPNQRPILYSPPVAVVKKRRHQQQPQPQSSLAAGRSTRNFAFAGPPRQRLPVRCISLDSRDIFAAMANRSCFVCNTTGDTEELSACTNCCNIYHISCHLNEEEEEDVQLFRQRDNLCPVCLTADDGDK